MRVSYFAMLFSFNAKLFYENHIVLSSCNINLVVDHVGLTLFSFLNKSKSCSWFSSLS